MPGESLHAAVEALRARLQSDLDTQLAEFQARLDEQHQQTLIDASRAAATAADEAWAARLAAASADAAHARTAERGRLEATHAAALEAGATERARLDHDLAAATQVRAAERGRLEVTHAAALEAGAAERDRLDHQLAAATQARAAEDTHLEAEHAAAREAGAAQRDRFDHELAAAAQAGAAQNTHLEAEHTAAPEAAGTPSPSPADDGGVGQLSEAMARIGRAGSLSDTLDALLHAARAHDAGAVLLVGSPEAQAGTPAWALWRATADASVADRELSISTARSGHTEASPDGTRLALPLIVGERPVAILVTSPPPRRRDLLSVLAQHAAATLARLTAVRVTQVMMGTPEVTAGGDDGSARRYARLLVSEIKLYNEAAVRTGRERGDLLARLGPEIDRARGLYEQRVPFSRDRASLFHDELVHTLAAGDAARLGAGGV